MALKVPPVLVFLLAGLLIWGLAGFPVRPPAASLTDALAAVLAVLGVTVGVLGVLAFRRAGTTVDPMHPEQASALVVVGIYRITRNPMYLGLALMLLAWCVYLEVWAGLLIVALFILYMNRFQIVPEERALESRFGEDFRRYRQSVRRWL
jgi:protein-S-isoprenylcysteine O-methyltransferase Ste14